MKDYEKAIGAYKQSEQLLKEHITLVKKTPKLPKMLSNVRDIDQNVDEDNSGQERGEEMIEANKVFDKKTAAEWNEHGNAHLKAGAYNDAIVAYTKAIELAPDACWPYIQNLAQVHYQKGKARGKLSIGKIDDPDVWEGEEEAEPDSLVSYDSLIDLEQTNENEEPGLEKIALKLANDPAIGTTDTQKQETEVIDPTEECSGKENEPVRNRKKNLKMLSQLLAVAKKNPRNPVIPGGNPY